MVTLAPVKEADFTFEGVPLPEACLRLEEAGATVVGLNCIKGPDTMLPAIREIRKVCKVSNKGLDIMLQAIREIRIVCKVCNCIKGPQTMLQVIRKMKKICKVSNSKVYKEHATSYNRNRKSM